MEARNYAEIPGHLNRYKFGTFELGYSPLSIWLNGLPAEQITVSVADDVVKRPSDLSGFYEDYCAWVIGENVERRAAGIREITNGDRFAVKRVLTRHSSRDSAPELHVELQRDKYYRYQSVLRNLDKYYDEEGGRRTTIRSEYLLSPQLNPYEPCVLVSDMGVGATVYLRPENLLVFAKRSRQVAVYAGQFCTAVAGGMRPQDVGDNPEGAVLRCLQRQAKTELGIDVSSEDVKFPLFGFSPHEAWYGPEGVISLNMTFADLCESAKEADDSFEIDSLIPIPATPVETALPMLFQRTQNLRMVWHPGYLANVLASIEHYNRETYQEYVAAICGSPQLRETIPSALMFPPLPLAV